MTARPLTTHLAHEPLSLPRSAHSFVERLRAVAASQQCSDPWLGQLIGLAGHVGPDGVARLSTVAVFDALGLKPTERTPAAGKRVKALMESLGWTALRQISLTPGGSRARLRGFARALSEP